MKQPINEIKRMQQLAGLITEAQLNENVDFSNWSYSDDHGVGIVFKLSPANPNSTLTDVDEEEEVTKESFWETDLKRYSRIPQGLYADEVNESGPVYANKLPNGTWEFIWDAGDISGFVEGEDFDFVSKEELP